MCGLLGLAFQKDSALTPELAGVVLSQLLLRNEGRGGDSFGVGIVVPEEKDIRLFKQVGKISKAGPSEPTWQGAIRYVMDKIRENKTVVAIGHNRKATTGANTIRNAHPFLCGKPSTEFVLGAHNGVIGPWTMIKNHWQINRNMEVDSEVLFRAMQKFEKEHDPDVKVLGQVAPMGTIATTYMRDFDTLNLHRGDNPLSVAVGDGYVFWSSLLTHLHDSTFGLNVKYPEITENTVLRVGLKDFTFKEVEVPQNLVLKRAMFPAPPLQKGKSGKGVVAADRRSSTPAQRDKSTIHRLFGPDTPGLDPDCDHSYGCSCFVDDDGVFDAALVSHTDKVVGYISATRHSQTKPSYGSTVDDLVPPTYTLLPRHAQPRIECCVCEHTSKDGSPMEKATYEPWELLWRGGDALCPICYYYMIQAEAEANVGSNGGTILT